MLALVEITGWHWIGFIACVLIFLALDLGVFHRHAHEVKFKEALLWTTIWFSLAVLLMLSSVVWDYLDGKIGRWLGTPHSFGKELDSLADVVGFGMAPAVFAYTYTTPHGWRTIVLVLFVLCGLLRLARFNVVNLTGEYIGMPITWNGLLVPLSYYSGLPPKYYSLVLLVSSVLMISPLRIKKWG